MPITTALSAKLNAASRRRAADVLLLLQADGTAWRDACEHALRQSRQRAGRGIFDQDVLPGAVASRRLLVLNHEGEMPSS